MYMRGVSAAKSNWEKKIKRSFIFINFCQQHIWHKVTVSILWLLVMSSADNRLAEFTVSKEMVGFCFHGWLFIKPPSPNNNCLNAEHGIFFSSRQVFASLHFGISKQINKTKIALVKIIGFSNVQQDFYQNLFNWTGVSHRIIVLVKMVVRVESRFLNGDIKWFLKKRIFSYPFENGYGDPVDEDASFERKRNQTFLLESVLLVKLGWWLDWFLGSVF